MRLHASISSRLIAHILGWVLIGAGAYYFQHEIGIDGPVAFFVSILLGAAPGALKLNPRVQAQLLAFPVQIGIAVTVALAVLAIVLLVTSQPATELSSQLRAFGSGLLIGSFLRMLVWRTVATQLSGNTNFRITLLNAIFFSLFFALAAHSDMFELGLYFLGSASGILLFSLPPAKGLPRRRDGVYVGVERYEAFEVPPEFVSLADLFVKNNWANFTNRLAELDLRKDGKLIPWLVLARACRLRQIGGFAGSNRLVEEELARPERIPQGKLDQMLHLLAALNYRDESRDSSAVFHLEKALELDPECPVARITKAVELAELSEILPDQTALNLMRGALLYIEGRRGLPIEKAMLAQSIPLSGVALLDLYAYVLAKSNHVTLAHALLLQCIEREPAYPNAYLHLGELMLLRTRRLQSILSATSERRPEDLAPGIQAVQDQKKQRSADLIRAGEIAVRTASLLDRRSAGRVRSRADKLLSRFTNPDQPQAA